MSRSPARVLGPVALVALALVALPSTALGQATRTWVSGVGDDANPCSRTAPCKTFAGAISKTAAKGEINVLDPGGFGAVTITKSIHIRARGHTAGVLTSAANAITVSAGVNDRVTLTGLDINGLDTATNGVRIISGRVVRIEKSEIYGFQAGVSFVSSTTKSRVIIQDSVIHDNAGAGGIGVAVAPTGANAAVTIRRTHIDDNTTGVATNSSGGQPAIVNLFNSSVTDNVTGILSFGSLGDIRIGSNEVTGNDTGLLAAGSGRITSYGNNNVNGNGTDGSPTNTLTTR